MVDPEQLAPDDFKDPELGQQLAHVDFNQPNIARIYDYYLGGAANFAVDRAVADRTLKMVPRELEYCRANRAFLARVVRTLAAEYGIDQFLDLGSGIPTVGNVHEIAHRHNPATRVAYVEWEDIAAHHARRLLGAKETRVTMTKADVCDPDSVLSAPGVTELLDFTRPVAVLALGILDITHEPDGAGLVRRYRDACCPGSALAISNDAQLSATDEEIAALREMIAQTSTPYLRLRTTEEVAELFEGYRLLEPGIVPAAQWRPEQAVADEEARQANVYGAAGILT